MATRYAELVRYGIVAHDDGSDRMEPVARGQWVRADEAAAAITALEARCEQLEAALKPFRLLANCTDSEPAGASVIVNVNRARDARDALASIESKP